MVLPAPGLAGVLAAEEAGRVDVWLGPEVYDRHF